MHKQHVATFLSIAGSFRSAVMGAVRRTSAGWRQAVKPFSPVGWHCISKVVATGLIKISPLSGTTSSSQVGGNAFLLANAVAATRPRHKPPTIPGKLARTFAKYPSQCTSLIIFISILSLVPLASLLCANILQEAWQDGTKEDTDLDEVRSLFVYMAAPIVRAPAVEPSRN